MHAAVKVFWLPKKGNAAEEYEDAAAYSNHRFAVADGATESSYADRWSRELVDRFVAAPPNHIRVSKVPMEEWLRPAQKQWRSGIPWDRLPWYAEEKARCGAFTTFLGVEITPAPSRFRFLDLFRSRSGVRWHAIAVGDSCFFHIRDDILARAFPLEKTREFSNRPLLISSNPSRNKSVWKYVRQAEGECRAGDLFILMTDALGHWFLRENENGRKPWRELLELGANDDFADFVEKRRAKATLRNDDTTLMICQWKEHA